VCAICFSDKSRIYKWHRYFYRGRRKVVPPDIARHLSPLAVAVWFMDDGASDFAGVTFQTHSFRLNEVRLLADSLRSSLGVIANLRRNEGAWILYVGASELPRFRDLVSRYILPDLSYKLMARPSATDYQKSSISSSVRSRGQTTAERTDGPTSMSRLLWEKSDCF
jgi:hypothetical protein